MINRILVLSLGSSLLFSLCHRSERTILAVDFSQAHTWRYLFGVDISGMTRSGDSSRNFSGSLRAFLTGERSPHDIGAVRFKTAGPIITSDFLTEGERTHLTREIENATFYFSPKEGAVQATDSAFPPALVIGGWDLFRGFARVLPVLPESAVRRGASWERARTFPIETSVGSAAGSLYQSFTFDSVTTIDSTPCAAIHWLFTYRIEPSTTDTVSYLDTLPLGGAGEGDALIDLSAKRIVKAHANFATAPVSGARLGASWRESVHLELVK